MPLENQGGQSMVDPAPSQGATPEPHIITVHGHGDFRCSCGAKFYNSYQGAAHNRAFAPSGSPSVPEEPDMQALREAIYELAQQEANWHHDPGATSPRILAARARVNDLLSRVSGSRARLQREKKDALSALEVFGLVPPEQPGEPWGWVTEDGVTEGEDSAHDTALEVQRLTERQWAWTTEKLAALRRDAGALVAKLDEWEGAIAENFSTDRYSEQVEALRSSLQAEAGT